MLMLYCVDEPCGAGDGPDAGDGYAGVDHPGDHGLQEHADLCQLRPAHHWTWALGATSQVPVSSGAEKVAHKIIPHMFAESSLT